MKQSEIYDFFNISSNNIRIPTVSKEVGTDEWYRSRFYLSTSDDLKLVTDSYDFNHKSVITVAGAGDFPINFYLAGAQNVVCFDISPQSCFFGELKVEALKKLNYATFIEFFYPKKYWSKYPQEEKHYSNEVYPFNPKVYEKLREEISQQAQKFFDLAFNTEISDDYLKISPDGGLVLRRGFSRARNFNPYLSSEKNYIDAQKTLYRKLCVFYPTSVEDYFDDFEVDSDYLYISNIFSDKFDMLIGFVKKIFESSRTKVVGATLFFPYADMNLSEELKNKEVRKRIGLSELNWKKMHIGKGGDVILIDKLIIRFFKSVKRTYFEVTLK